MNKTELIEAISKELYCTREGAKLICSEFIDDLSSIQKLKSTSTKKTTSFKNTIEKGKILETIASLFYNESFKKDFPNSEIVLSRNKLAEDKYGKKRELDIEIDITLKSSKLPLKIIIECKYYNKRIEPKIIEAFASRLRYFNANIGIILTTVGYQKTAIDTAIIEGIQIHVVVLKFLDENIDIDIVPSVNNKSTSKFIYAGIQNYYYNLIKYSINAFQSNKLKNKVIYSNPINRKELVKNVHSVTHSISKITPEFSVNFKKVVQKKLIKDKVSLVGFGTYSVVKRRVRIGRNPQTGKPFYIKPSKLLKFKSRAFRF